MSDPDYFERFENLAMERDEDGVLTVRFHTNGGPCIFTGQTHQDFTEALERISLDGENHVVVLTGSGDAFMDQIDGPSLGDITDPLHWERIRAEGLKILLRLVELPMPVVGVANGPATVHSEYLLLADVHIASERAVYGDFPHPAFGITGGDGLQVVWEEVAGPTRAKWLLWSGETIDAATAMQWGVVTEVLPPTRCWPAVMKSPGCWPANLSCIEGYRSRPSTRRCVGGSSKASRMGWRSRG